MEFDISKIRYSINDIKLKIKIPTKMSSDLAEFIGIMVGDGHIGKYGHGYIMVITGNVLDKNYYHEYVNKLTKDLFGIKFNVIYQKSRNAIIIKKQSKAIFHFLHDVVKIPQTKENVKIPACIQKSRIKYKKAFIRGLADSDFCFTIKYKPKKYPVIHGTSKSRKLIKSTSRILSRLNIKNNVQREEIILNDKLFCRYRVYINGHKNVKSYMEKIGFSNDNKIKKYIKFLNN